MKKIVTFSSGGGINNTKEFTASLVKQRLREQKKSLKYRFRMLIKDYTQLFKSGKDLDATEALFRKDLLVLLSEAISEVQNCKMTLNRALNLTSIIPGARTISNKLNMLVRKIGKFYSKNGYINKMFQTKFNDLFIELINIVTEKVKGGEVNPDAEENENETEEEVIENAATKKFSKNKITLFTSDIETILASADLDEVNIDEIDGDRVTMSEDEVPEQFAKKFSAIRFRSHKFNSEMKCFSVKFTSSMDMMESLPIVLDSLKDKGILSKEASSLSYDIDREGDDLKYKFYVNPNEVQLVNGEDQIDLNSNDKFEEIFKVIDEGLTTSKLMALESIVRGLDKNELCVALVNRYGNNPIEVIL